MQHAIFVIVKPIIYHMFKLYFNKTGKILLWYRVRIYSLTQLDTKFNDLLLLAVEAVFRYDRRISVLVYVQCFSRRRVERASAASRSLPMTKKKHSHIFSAYKKCIYVYIYIYFFTVHRHCENRDADLLSVLPILISV